ncbi:hypothetical protein J1N35_023804 [Gossypium stocksii]|uniref:Uncharacterized protein n=1 Tax=Gossypium stocksii TaxID=47602 RepID=A0A9D3VJ67_9ROSI|nr:hypothetical protein J1N35_023804 [Gossypium stocksii]
MDRPPSTRGLPIIFMLDHLLLKDDEISTLILEVLKRLNSRLAQHGRLGPMYLNIERQGSFRMFPSGFFSENGLDNAAMMGYAFDPNKTYVFVIGKLSGGELCCVITENLADIYKWSVFADDEGPRLRAEAIAERICQVLERKWNI